jgi:chitinase
LRGFAALQLYNQGGDGITAGDKYVSATNNQAAFISGVCEYHVQRV